MLGRLVGDGPDNASAVGRLLGCFHVCIIARFS